MMSLNNLHVQVQNISTQATLIVGFSLATMGADLLNAIASDTSEFCIWKTSAHLVVGYMFVLSSAFCICYCMFVVVLSSTIIRESQVAALEVDPAASVAMTRHTVDRIYAWYGYSLVNFFVSAVLLIWLFIGMPKWVEVSIE